MIIYSHEESEKLINIIKILAFNESEKTIVICPSLRQGIEIVDSLSNQGLTFRREVDRIQSVSGNIVFMSLGNGDKIRGLRAQNILVHNHRNIDQDNLKIVIQGFMVCSSDPLGYIKRKKENE